MTCTLWQSNAGSLMQKTFCDPALNGKCMAFSDDLRMFYSLHIIQFLYIYVYLFKYHIYLYNKYIIINYYIILYSCKIFQYKRADKNKDFHKYKIKPANFLLS